MNNTLLIPVTLTEKQFKNFLLFDTMRKQRRWKTAASLAVMCFFLATLCFASQESHPHIEIFGDILIMVCVFIPTNYFRSFYNALNKETQKMNLREPRHVYTISLSDGIELYYPGEALPASHYLWSSAAAWKTHDAIYLYVAPGQALIIPKGITSPSYNSIWEFLEKNLKASQLHK